MKPSHRSAWYVIGAACLLTIVIYSAPVLTPGARPASSLGNIHGILYPTEAAGTIVSEPLAHTDVYLHEPVWGKNLTVTLDYIPHDAQTLSLGVRQNDFWLSYEPIVFYQAGLDSLVDTEAPRTAKITLPLTDKLQDQDRSIDLMLFTDYSGDPRQVEQLSDHQPHWYVQHLATNVTLTLPTYAQSRDYVRSIFKRERPL